MDFSIKTANGFIKVKPVFCEITGRQICWQSYLTEEQLRKGYTPAYISFNAFSQLGVVKIDMEKVDTF